MAGRHSGVRAHELGGPAPARTLPVGEPEPDARRVAALARHYGAEVLTTWP